MYKYDGEVSILNSCKDFIVLLRKEYHCKEYFSSLKHLANDNLKSVVVAPYELIILVLPQHRINQEGLLT